MTDVRCAREGAADEAVTTPTRQWHTSTFCGVSTTFRALDDRERSRDTPTSAWALLDRRLATLERLCSDTADNNDNNNDGSAAQRLREAARCVYGAVRVHISLRDDDDDAEAMAWRRQDDEQRRPSQAVAAYDDNNNNDNDNDDNNNADDDDVTEPWWVEDVWSPLYLAVQLAHTRALSRLLAFHATFAVAVMEQLLRDATPSAAAATTTTTAILPQPLLRCVTLPSWGGVVVLLSRHDVTSCRHNNSDSASEAHARAVAAAEEALLADAEDGEVCVASVLSFVRPLVQWAVRDARQQQQQQSSSSSSPTAAATTPTESASDAVVRAWLQQTRADAVTHARLPSLVVGVDDVYELCTAACDGDEVRVLLHVLACCAGALVPVLRGCEACSCGSNGSSSGCGGASVARHQRHGSGSRGSALPTPNASQPHSRAASLSLVPPAAPHVHALGASSPPAQAAHNAFAATTTSTTTNTTTNTTTTSADATAMPSLSMCGLALAMTTTTSSEAFWLSCAAQEPSRVALCALWTDYRQYAYDANSAGRLRRTARLLQECHAAQALLRRAKYNNSSSNNNNSSSQSSVSLRRVWSAQLLVTAQLCSATATLEDFVDMLGEADDDDDDHNDKATVVQQTPHHGHDAVAAATTTAMQQQQQHGSVQGMPGAVVSLLAASVVAAARVADAAALQLLERKAAALLCASCGPRRLGSVRAYLLACPASHAERFAVLWLRHTDTSHNNNNSNNDGSGGSGGGELRKYATRIELLYACAVDGVLSRAERAWSSSLPSSSDDANADSSSGNKKAQEQRVCALLSWLQLWRGVLVYLRDAAQQRHAHTRTSSSGSRSSSRSSSEPVDANTTTTTTTTTTTEPPQLFEALLQRLHDRLQHGKAPLPTLYARLQQQQQQHETSDKQTHATTTRNNNDDDDNDVAARFDVAQRRFAQMAAAQSNDVKLRFYGLYKQATLGDVNTPQPWRFDWEGRAKWQAWQQCRGMTRDEAMRAYVGDLHALTTSDGDDNKQQ